jgi:hypothetical protein
VGQNWHVSQFAKLRSKGQNTVSEFIRGTHKRMFSNWLMASSILRNVVCVYIYIYIYIYMPMELIGSHLKKINWYLCSHHLFSSYSGYHTSKMVFLSSRLHQLVIAYLLPLPPAIFSRYIYIPGIYSWPLYYSFPKFLPRGIQKLSSHMS